MTAITLQQIEIARLRESAHNPRRHFSEGSLKELADNIALVGVLTPLLVRPDMHWEIRQSEHTGQWQVGCVNTGGGWNIHHGEASEDAARKWIAQNKPAFYEIAAGHRRFRAAKAAGLSAVPCIVRELSDAEFMEIMTIENLQREDVHPLDEGLGYEALMQRHGYRADALAAKVGKSKAYIYARLKLCALGETARAAFLAGKVEASTALLLARIPVPALQEQALAEICRARFSNAGPMSYREAAEHIHRTYMLRLADAPFPCVEADLVPGVPRCQDCPKRTGAQPELFADVKSADVCTDPECFAAKRAAHAARRRAEAEAAGRIVITGKDANKIKPHDYGGLGGGYVALDAKCYEDPKHRTYRQILGKSGPAPALLEDPSSGDLLEIAPIKELKPILEAKGVKARVAQDASDAHRAKQRAEEKKNRAESAYRLELLRAINNAAPATLGRDELVLVAQRFFTDIWHENRRKIAALKGWDKKDMDRDAVKQIAALPAEALSRLLLAIALVGEVHVGQYSKSRPEGLLAWAARYGVDAAALRKRLQDEAKAKKPAPKARKAETKAPKTETPAKKAKRQPASQPQETTA